MASIGVLVKAIAEVSKLEEGTVALVARYAREAGYINQGTRGPGAARMTERDAANLLIALQGALLAKDAARAVARYRNLKAEHDEISNSIACPDFVLRAMQSGTTFGTCLEQIIAGFMSSDAQPSEWGEYTQDDSPGEIEKENGLTVTFDKPISKASIVFFKKYENDSLRLVFSDESRENETSGHDWMTVTSFTDTTLKVLGKVLSS